MVRQQRGFTYIEILVACAVLFTALFYIGSTNMSSIRLLSKSKLQQKATMLLMNKVEELRVIPLESLTEGVSQEKQGQFLIECSIRDHTPFLGTKQIRCRALYGNQTMLETLFYRSE